MRNAARKKNYQPHSALAVNSRFGRYGPEPEKIVRRPEVKPGKTRHIVAAWDGFVKIAAKTEDWDDIYSAAIAEIRGIPRASRTEKAVELFSMGAAALDCGHHFDLSLGLFLSALVNIFPSNDYALHTDFLECPPVGLGYRNTKNLTIHGPAGENFGYMMRKGKVIVNGPAGGNLCNFMTGGSVLVRGDAGRFAGGALIGGEITVQGDVEAEAGRDMKGGLLRVMGKMADFSDEAKGGKIYAGGKLVFNKPSASSKKHLANMADVDELNEFLRASEGDADG